MNKYQFSLKHVFAILPFLVFLYFVFPEAIIFFVGFFGIGGIIIFLVVKLLQKILAPTMKMHEDFLKANGFVPCTPEEAQKLHALVGRIKGIDGESYYLNDGVKSEKNGKTTFQYFYTEQLRMGVHNTMRAIRRLEFIVPLTRKSPDPAIVVLKRKDGMGKMLQNTAGKLAPTLAKATTWNGQTLEVLPLPASLENGNIFTVFGPPQKAVLDLVDAKVLEIIGHGLEVTGESVILAEGQALLSFITGYLTAPGYARLPAYLAELTSQV